MTIASRAKHSAVGSRLLEKSASQRTIVYEQSVNHTFDEKVD